MLTMSEILIEQYKIQTYKIKEYILKRLKNVSVAVLNQVLMIRQNIQETDLENLLPHLENRPMYWEEDEQNNQPSRLIL